MRKVLEMNGKTEILSIPNISMKPQNNIIFLNIQNRLSVSFITTTDFCMLHDCRRFQVQQYQGLSIA